MRILIPDHSAAIPGVSQLLDDFAEQNGIRAEIYLLAAMQDHLKSLEIDQASTEFDAFLRDGPISLLMVPTTIGVNKTLHRITKAAAFATPSTGEDHVDLEYLEKQGLPFFTAPGENALSVVEYVLSAFPILYDSQSLVKKPPSLGIVGSGRIGSALRSVAERIGFRVKAYDPPRFGKHGPSREQVLDSDIITFHVPLVKTGEHPTFQMIDQEWMKAARANSVWINTARGPILSPANLEALSDRFQTVIDVFPVEPARSSWIQSTTLVSPHVAGYSWRARFGGVYRVIREFAAASSLILPVDLQKYRPPEFELHAADFLQVESALLKKDPGSFASRRNGYPARSSFRDEIEAGKNHLDLRASEDRQYYLKLFKIWNELNLY